jgi:hypothetical protein
MLQIAKLLIHSEDVPPAARAALSTAFDGPQDERCDNLVQAARSLHFDAGLDCADARELVGLVECGCVTA